MTDGTMGRRQSVRAIIAVTLLGLFSCAGILKAQYVQSWNEVDFTARWRSVNLTFPFVARFDPESPNLQLTATGMTADVPIVRHVTATAGYYFAELPQSSLAVHIPLIACTLSWRWRNFDITERNRVEELIGYKDSPYRYRNRLMVDRPFGRVERWHAFVANEVFLISGDGWNQNRFQTGIGRALGQRARLDVYYLLKIPHGAAAIQVAGTTLRIALTHQT